MVKKGFNSKKLIMILLPLVGAVAVLLYSYSQLQVSQNTLSERDKLITETQEVLDKTKVELEELKSQDQIKINEELKEKVANVEDTYDSAVKVFEDLLDLKTKSKDTTSLDKLFAESLSLLSNQEYEKAKEKLNELSNKITEEDKKIAASFVIPANVPVNNSPPGAGYSRQQVASDVGTFMVSMVAGDLSSTRVIVDTASTGDCGDNCPVLPLATYVSRNGAFAGINGSYFCPASYPSCAGKTNSFDLLVMNKDKTYFNSSNNVYSNNPAVIFGDGYIRFVSAASSWGRDTSPTGVLSNYPLLLMGGNVTFGGDDDPKKGSRGPRGFVANKGNTVYIGVVSSATVAEAAHALKALGMENGMNLDSGGSTALWSGGYKAGPGRDIPNAILFVRK